MIASPQPQKEDPLTEILGSICFLGLLGILVFLLLAM